MHTSILVYNGFTALDAIGPYEILSRIPGNRVQFVAKEKGPIAADTGMLTIVAEASLSDVANTDILLIPGGSEGTQKAAEDPNVLAWVKRMHAKTTWTTSVCTGSLILGSAGLLQGLDATTHWAAKDRLNQLGAIYQAERYVQQDKIITAAGVSAGIDMALYLTSKLANDTIAQVIQLAAEYDPDPPFDAGSPQKASADVIAIATGALSGSFNS